MAGPRDEIMTSRNNQQPRDLMPARDLDLRGGGGGQVGIIKKIFISGFNFTSYFLKLNFELTMKNANFNSNLDLPQIKVRL